MRVLNVVLDNHIGGPQIRLLSVAKGLKSYGIETIIVCPYGDGGFADKARNDKFKVYQIPFSNPKYFNGISSTIFNLKWILKSPCTVYIFLKIIKMENIDIVHANGLLCLHAPMAAVLAKRKIVWHLIGSLYPRWILNILVPFIKIIADRIIVVAETLGQYYLGKDFKANLKNVSVISEGIDTNKFYCCNFTDKEILELKHSLNIKPTSKIVGAIGNVNPVKGYEFFIEAMNIVKNKISNITFLIIGDIPQSQQKYFQRLQNQINNSNMNSDVLFMGKRDDIPYLLSLFDIFVLTSISEGTPLVILEAMAMEKPVVATSVGAIREVLIDKEMGMIVPPYDPISIADAVIFLLNNPQKRSDMGKRGRARVESFYSIDKCIYEHMRTYSDLVFAL